MQKLRANPTPFYTGAWALPGLAIFHSEKNLYDFYLKNIQRSAWRGVVAHALHPGTQKAELVEL